MPDGVRSQGRDPGQTGRREVLSQPRRSEHAAVSDQGDGFDAEALLDLLHLRRHRARIPRVAREHLHGQRATIPGAEQAEDDLPLASLAVAVVAECGQGTAAPLEIAGGDVIKQKCPALQVPSRQALLDPDLAAQQPVKHRQHLVAADRTEAEERTEAAGGGLRRQAPGGGELGGGLQHPGDDGGEGEVEVAVAAAFPVQEAFQTELAAETEEGGDMTMGQSAANGEGLVQGTIDLAPLEQSADAVDDLRGEFGEVGEGGAAERLPSRLAWRKRMAGGLLRLGMTSTW